MESPRVSRVRRQENRASREEEVPLQRVSSEIEIESESISPSPPGLEELESYFQEQEEQQNQLEQLESDTHLQKVEHEHQQPEPQLHLEEPHHQTEQSSPQTFLQEQRDQTKRSASPQKHSQVEPLVHTAQSQELQEQMKQSNAQLKSQKSGEMQQLGPMAQSQEQHHGTEQTSQPKSQWQDPEPAEMTKSQLELQEQHQQMEQDSEQNIVQSIEHVSLDLPPRAVRNHAQLYNFKGFMLFCFGVPGISPNWCSCLLFFYHVLLFTVGIGTVILGGISVALRREMSLTKQFIFADVLSILAGTLYLLAASYGGCIWTWRTSFLPRSCSRSFLPLSILAWILSLCHAALVAAFVTVMINNGQAIVNNDIKFELNMLSLWTLGGLALWAVCFLLGLFPSIMLFKRKFKPMQV